MAGLAVLALAGAAVVAAYVDGGYEPVRTITVPVERPAQGDAR